jgi:hypothetical protein
VTISVLVPCTASKRSTVPPVALGEFRAGKSATERDRFDNWWFAVSERSKASDEDVRPAKDRYKGAGWQASLSLVRAVHGLGQVSGYVVSAGLGLVALTEATPSYSATFNPNQPDSVPRGRGASVVRQHNQGWWRELESARQRSVRSLADLSSRALVAMPPRYVAAVEPALLELSECIPVTIYTTGAPPESLEPITIRVRQNLKRVPGPGSNASDATLIANVATWCVEQLGDAAFDAGKVQLLLDSYADAAAGRPQRPRASDEEVLAYLRKRLPRELRPATSASRLHRRFRDSGRGCSSERFKELFSRALSEQLPLDNPPRNQEVRR